MSENVSSDDTKAVLSIDIGGSHVKLRSSAVGDEKEVESGKAMTGPAMVDAVKAMAEDLRYDVITIGYPGPVVHDRRLREPVKLGGGWVGYDYQRAFGCPVRIINDALILYRVFPVKAFSPERLEGRT